MEFLKDSDELSLWEPITLSSSYPDSGPFIHYLAVIVHREKDAKHPGGKVQPG
jgi:hypothetical protein